MAKYLLHGQKPRVKMRTFQSFYQTLPSLDQYCTDKISRTFEKDPEIQPSQKEQQTEVFLLSDKRNTVHSSVS